MPQGIRGMRVTAANGSGAGAPWTSPIGHPDVLWGMPGQGGLLTEWSETVPDLTWPDSVRTYGRMRRDPRLSAVLASYFLPIIRTTWAVDPEGVARDEAVALVASDLGLPILGEKGVPGDPAMKGFTWHEHVRLALLSMIYGYFPFEQWFEVVKGRTHLAGVQERQPHTISIIDIAEDGNVFQVYQNTQNEPIPANRLLWYVHEREGANWAGVSMLRCCYTPWILKHETLRVHATSIRRFGMGVPNVEAPPGATPGQIQQAQQLASQMRVGDTQGVGLPSGFKFNITGMTGSAPDAVGFLQYLDQEMTTSALAQIVELGHGTYGTRALGESFLDLFLLSLQAAADAIGDTATFGSPTMPGLARSLVDFNWGEDEPCPRIVATDVGDRHEITANAISQMITAGALSPDPNLEAFLREAWGLPERSQDFPAPAAELPWAPKGKDVPAGGAGAPAGAGGGGDNTDQDATPSADGGAQTTLQAGQAATTADGKREGRTAGSRRARPWSFRRLTFRGRAKAPPGLRRPLTATEAAAGMEPLIILEESQQAAAGLIGKWEPIARAMKQDIAEQVAAAVDAHDIDALTSIKPDTAAAADTLAASMQDMAWTGAGRLIKEAATQGVIIDPGKVAIDDDRIAQIARARAALIGARFASEAARTTLHTVAATAGSDAAQQVNVHLDGLSTTPLQDQLQAAMTAAQNMGRIEASQAGLDAGNTGTFTASEILDQNTCDPCAAIDGTDFDTIDDAEAAYANGGYVDCLGLERCRGTLIVTWDTGGAAAADGDGTGGELAGDLAGEEAGDLAGEEADAGALPWTADGDVATFADSLGIARADMPQLSGMVDGEYHPAAEMTPKFVRTLLDDGVKVTSERVPASTLLPTQTDGDLKIIRSIAGDLKSGKLADTKQIVVSSDDRILDGHHTWAGRLLADSEGGRDGLDPGMPALRVDRSMDDLLADAREFTSDEGLPNLAEGQVANPARLVVGPPVPADTASLFKGADGAYTPARQALHQQIVDDILAGQEAQDNPVAVFLGGGPGAGKISALPGFADAAQIAADDIKTLLPEYQQMLADGDPRAAMFVHEESTDIAALARVQAEEGRMNYLLDGTGDRTLENIASKVREARAAGYEIRSQYATIDTDTAVARAALRAEETGRAVPESVIRAVHAGVSQVYAEAVAENLFDQTELWDNNGAEGAAKLIAHKDPDGAFTVDDPAAYGKFLAKADPAPTATEVRVAQETAAREQAEQAEVQEAVTREAGGGTTKGVAVTADQGVAASDEEAVTGALASLNLSPASQQALKDAGTTVNVTDEQGIEQAWAALNQGGTAPAAGFYDEATNTVYVRPGATAAETVQTGLMAALNRALGYPGDDPDWQALATQIRQSGVTIGAQYQAQPGTSPAGADNAMWAALAGQWAAGTAYTLGSALTEDMAPLISEYFQTLGI